MEVIDGFGVALAISVMGSALALSFLYAGDENAGPVNNHLRISFVKPDGTETEDLDEATK